MRQTNVRGTLSLRGFRKLRTGAIVATGVILLGLGFLAPTVSASEQDGVWVARTVEEVKADLQKEGDLFKYVIKWGDTLSVISEASNIPVDVLQEMNQASGKNLFLPHNELYFTEAETVSDTVTKHKIVIKESGASGEVRTYEVLLKKDQETKAVTFELTDVTEKVEKMTVNYSPVYQPVSAPIVERAEESGEEPASEASAETSPEVKEETEAPVAPKVEEPAESVEPKVTEPEVANPAEPNAETPTESTEPKAEVSEAPVVGGTTSGEQGQPAEPKGTEPEATNPAEPKAETPAPKVEESTTPTPKEDATEGKVEAPKVEEPETSAEPTETAPVVAKPAESKEAEPEATKPAEPKEEGTTAEAGTEVNPTAKEDAPEGTVESESAPKENAPEGTVSEASGEESGAIGETSGATSGDEEKDSKVGDTDKETGSKEEGEAETTEDASTTPSADATNESGKSESSSPVTDATPSNGETTEQPVASNPSSEASASSTEDSATGDTLTPGTSTNTDESGKQSVDSSHSGAESVTEVTGEASETTTGAEGKESAEAGTSATTETATPAPAVDSTNEAPNEGESENPVAEGTPVTEEQPSTDNTASSSATSDSADSSPSTESTATEGITDTTGNTSNNSSTDVTTDGSSDNSASHEEKPQADASAVEHQDSEKSLEEDTKDSNKAAIDDDRKTKDEEINKSTLSEDKKKEELEKVKQLTEEYHKKLAAENDPDKQANLVDEYRDKLNEIETPGIEHTGPDFKKPIESHTGGTTIDENSTVANSALTSSNPTSQPSSSGESSQTQPAATSDSSTTGNSGFRRAGEYQARARRTTRSVNQPDGTVNISYMYDEMPDIHGFLSDPGEDNTVTIPAGTSEAQAKELVKEKIQAKIKDLAARGYHVKNDIIFEQDTIVKNFNYVVTFTKQTTGTTGFRIAPKVQVRAKKVVKRDLSNKTKQINVYYNLTALKDIAGALGELGGENVLTFSGETSKEELKRAVEEKTKAQIEKLKKQGFTVTSKTDLDQIVEGGDSYDYVVEFTKEAKTQPVGTTGFRKAPLVQRRAKRSTEVKETVNVNIYFNLKTLPGIAGALDVDGETTIKLPKNASEEEVKEAIKAKIAKVENRGYKVSDSYFGAKTEKGYDYVVEFTK